MTTSSDDRTQAARQLLDGLVDEPVLAAYLRLLESDGCPCKQAGEVLGGDEHVRELVSRGMAYASPADPSAPPKLIPASPAQALEAVLTEAARCLSEAPKRLLDGQRRLDDVRREASGGQACAGNMIEEIRDTARIHELSYSLMTSARHEWLTLENLEMDTPYEEESVVPPLSGDTVRCRSIYSSDYLKNPVAAAGIERSVEAGEQARILPRVGTKMKMADDRIAMIALTRTGTGGVLLVRSTVFLEMLRDYFELLWCKAAPFGAGPRAASGPLGEVHLKVLQMVVQGLKDETMADRLGISVQSVQRHVRKLKDELRAETLGALGAAAVRNGLVQ